MASLAQKRNPDGKSCFNLLPYSPLRVGVTVTLGTGETLQESFRLAAPQGRSCARGRSGLGLLRPRGPRKFPQPQCDEGGSRLSQVTPCSAWGERRAERQLLCRPSDPRSRRAPCARSAAPAAGEGREAREAGAAPGPALPIPAQGALCGRAAAGPHVLFVSINSPLRGLCICVSPCLHSCAVPRGTRGLSPRPGAATEG